MRNLTIAALVGLSLGLSGCVISVDGDGEYSHKSSWESKERKNRQHISHLEQHASYQDILSRMGVADFNELYEKEGDTYQVLYYRTQRIEGDGITTKDECTPLVFKNGALVGWGDSARSMIHH